MRKPNVFTKAWWLDKKRCRHIGCRTRTNLEEHHIIPRSLGGPDKIWNIITLCAFHHALITAKKLTNIELLTKYLKKNGVKFRWQKALDWHLKREELRKLKNE